LTFNDDQVGVIGNGAKLLAKIVLKNKLANSSTYPEFVTFTFEFNYTLPDITAFVDVVPKEIFWKDGILQANVNRPNSVADFAVNCWFNTPIEVQPWDKFQIDKKGLCIANTKFEIKKVTDIDNEGKWSWIDYSESSKGVYLSEYDGEVSIALNKEDDDVKETLNSDNGLQAEVAYVATLETGDVVTLYSFVVNFIRPLTLNMPEGLSVIDAKTGGDVIDFDYTGLLVDWRGELVLPPSWTPQQNVTEWYYWKKVCSPADHALVVPGYQIVDEPAKWDIEFQDVTIPVAANQTYTLYTYTHTYEYCANMVEWFEKVEGANVNNYYSECWENERTHQIRTTQPSIWSIDNWIHRTRPTETWTTGTVSGQGRSPEEAEQNAVALLDQISPYFRNGYDNDGCVYSKNYGGNLASQEVSGSTTTQVTFKNMVRATYIPAVYKEFESYIDYSECSEMPATPVFEDIQVGDRVGCWQWTKASVEWTSMNYDPGQYWFFYGPISAEVELDLDKVTTSLSDKKLPAGASLVQTGNTLKYENVLSPIQHSYHIFIPATVTYGWGTLNSHMTILVKPVATIGGGE